MHAKTWLAVLVVTCGLVWGCSNEPRQGSGNSGPWLPEGHTVPSGGDKDIAAPPDVPVASPDVPVAGPDVQAPPDVPVVEDLGPQPPEDTGAVADPGLPPVEDVAQPPEEIAQPDVNVEPELPPPEDVGGPGEDTGPASPDSGQPPPTCVDNDKDTFGKDCLSGPDCDDSNPNFNIFCPDCGQGNHPGCPCTGGSVLCYSGNAAQLGKGACKAGQQPCVGGWFSTCMGEVLPTPEACDGVDNNCDGQIDEGALSPCGNCDMSCTVQGQGPGTPEPFNPTPENAVGLKLDSNGYLVVDAKKANANKYFIWIANSSENTVSKLDTKTGWEVGRYKACSNPSRTSVDLVGDVWVGCRGDGGVMKIQADTTLCTDKNKNGQIDTAQDLNGDHHIQSNEMVNGDECIKFIVFPDGATIARAAGVDKDNHVWIGFWNSQNLRRLEPENGQVVDTINIACHPYGLVIDQQGIIWAQGSGCGKLVRADPKTHKVDKYSPGGGYSPYGINVDAFGKPWVADCGSYAAWRYDPITGQWNSLKGCGRGRGIATSADGYIYVANDTGNAVTIINGKTLQHEGCVSLGGGKYPVGIALDFDGYVWAVNQSAGSATKVDPKAKNIIGEYKVGSGPYTYSDMTGYTLKHFTVATGTYKSVFGMASSYGSIARIDEEANWESLDVDADLPGKSYLTVKVRSGADMKEMAAAKWAGPFGPFPPQKFPVDLTQYGLKGKLIEIELELQADKDDVSPVVKAIKVKGKLVPKS